MNKMDLYAISDLVLQKLNQLDREDIHGNIEKGLLESYIKHLMEIQNKILIQAYADSVFGRILQTIFYKTVNELSKKEPNLNKLLKTMKPIEDFMRDKIGYDEKEIDRRVIMSDEDIQSDLDTLEEEIKEWLKEMPKVALASEIKEDLDELKEQYEKIKVGNKWIK